MFPRAAAAVLSHWFTSSPRAFASRGPWACVGLVLHLCTPAFAQSCADENGGLFARGCLSAEVTGIYLVEAWDYNLSREVVLGESIAVSIALRDGWTLGGEALIVHVAQRAPDAVLSGGSLLVRRRLSGGPRGALFLEGGVGMSYSTRIVPDRGTRFNYLAQVGAGFTRRLARGLDLITRIGLLHVSNNSLNGRSHNPDIQAVGGRVGLAVRF